jgi:hypothetical protein
MSALCHYKLVSFRYVNISKLTPVFNFIHQLQEMHIQNERFLKHLEKVISTSNSDQSNSLWYWKSTCFMRSHHVDNNQHKLNCWPHQIDPTHNHELLVRHQRTHSCCKMTKANEYNLPVILQRHVNLQEEYYILSEEWTNLHFHFHNFNKNIISIKHVHYNAVKLETMLLIPDSGHSAEPQKCYSG